MNLPSLPETLNMDEVIRAPLGTEIVELPLLEDVEEGQVVAFRNEEFFPGRVRLFLSVLRFLFLYFSEETQQQQFPPPTEYDHTTTQRCRRKNCK